VADLAEVRQSIEATRALLREQEAALRTAEDEQKQAEQRGAASRLEQEVAEMEPKHRDLVARCRAAQDEFERLVKETDEVAIEVQTCDNAMGNAAWTLQQLNMTKPPRYATEQEIADRNATIGEARLAHANAVEKSRDIWTRYDSLRTERAQAHEAFSKLVDEERICAALLAGKQRELGKLRPAPVMEPPSHLVPLIERFRAQQAQLV
jgi:chromosome segregation ATPase